MSSRDPGIASFDDAAPSPGTERLPLLVRAALMLVILTGLSLRVALPETSVFYFDQARTCALAEDIVNGEWQTGGLVNSGEFRNLPGYPYVMAAVWAIWPDPLALISFTELTNVLAVALAAYLMWRWVGSSAAWWGTAFLAAGPWPIHFSRWIWAQHLLFPVCILIYLFLWQWIGKGRKWGALGVVLALTLAVQIHLAAVVLALAVGLLVLWCRPKLPVRLLTVGTLVALATVAPYLRDGHFESPLEQRFGYQHFWRVVPGAAMSVSGLAWQAKCYNEGYSAFAEDLNWRRWPYEAIMVVPAALLGWGAFLGIRRLWRQRRSALSCRRTPLSMVTALVFLIPLCFGVLAIRTSPTYLTLWYPLPFVLMGWAAVRLGRGRAGGRGRAWLNWVLLGVLGAQLCFFVEQLRYVDSHGGLPQSRFGRGYGGMKADIAELAPGVRAREIWMKCDDVRRHQKEPLAYLLRHADWPTATVGRAVIHTRQWSESTESWVVAIEMLPDDAPPPSDAYQIRPWTGRQQQDGVIPKRPVPAGQVDELQP